MTKFPDTVNNKETECAPQLFFLYAARCTGLFRVTETSSLYGYNREKKDKSKNPNRAISKIILRAKVSRQIRTRATSTSTPYRFFLLKKRSDPAGAILGRQQISIRSVRLLTLSRKGHSGESGMQKKLSKHF